MRRLLRAAARRSSVFTSRAAHTRPSSTPTPLPSHPTPSAFWFNLGVLSSAAVVTATAAECSASPPAAPDCTVPACRSSTSSFYASMKRATKDQSGDAAAPRPCPPGREELGHHSWTLVSERRLILFLRAAQTKPACFLFAARSHQLFTLYLPSLFSTAAPHHGGILPKHTDD